MGYKIPFIRRPIQKIHPPSPEWNNAQIIDISSHLKKLLDKGVIRKCKPVPGQFLSSIFTVPKPDGSTRLILNLKNLNEFVKVEHFKLEDYKMVSNLMAEDCFMSTIDLTDAFYMVNISADDTKFLRFVFLDDLYEFACVPFGLCTAPYIFTKIMKPVLLYLRFYLKIVLVLYLDDFLIFGESFAQCWENVMIIKRFLESLGFIINIKKSQFTPSKQRQFLGLIFDSTKMHITLPLDKKEQIYNEILNFERREKCKIRDFAEFIGRLVFASHGVKYSLVYTKAFEREKFLALELHNNNYDAHMVLNPKLGLDFQWWKDHIFSSFNPVKPFDFQLEIFTDASPRAWGVYCVHGKSHGAWTREERSLHIIYLN